MTKEDQNENHVDIMMDVTKHSESSSLSSSDEELGPSYLQNLSALKDMIFEDDLSENEMKGDDCFALEYETLAEEEGLKYLVKSVPLDARLEAFGEATSFVEKILVVKSFRADLVVDLDALLVLEDRRVVGKVFEVFGPVDAPLYSVLCHPEFLDLPLGTRLYYLPDQTALVQKAELLAQKCTDADPDAQEEYSDDEEEARERKGRRKPKRPAADLEPGEIDE